MKVIDEATLAGKKVLIRVDLNVPMKDGQITDDYRLRAILPTLHYLINRDAKIILMGHLGHPEGADSSELSLKPVYLRLSALLKKSISFAPQIFSEKTTAAIENLKPGELIGLENLRFNKGEEAASRTFAARLSKYGDIYVNDAFSVSHRDSASMVTITEFLPSYAGLLLEKELQMLGSLLRHPASPFVAIIGGAKISDKLPIIEQLIHKADRVLVGGGVANNFLAAQGSDVKDSLIDKDYLEKAKKILTASKGKIVLPSDYVWKGGKIIADIGPKSTALFLSYVGGAKTIFWNGCLGITEEKEYSKSSDEMAKAIVSSRATSIIGGGNTMEVLGRLGLMDKVTFTSSGGGASLEFLGGKKLPGIEALN